MGPVGPGLKATLGERCGEGTKRGEVMGDIDVDGAIVSLGVDIVQLTG